MTTVTGHGALEAHAPHPILAPRVYWTASGYMLVTAAAAGFLVNILFGNEQGLGSFLVFDWMHNGLHAFLGVAALFFAYGPLAASVTRTMAILFGFVYGGLGVVGLVLGQWDLVPGLGVELGENLIHAALGAWALASGFLSKA